MFFLSPTDPVSSQNFHSQISEDTGWRWNSTCICIYLFITFNHKICSMFLFFVSHSFFILFSQAQALQYRCLTLTVSGDFGRYWFFSPKKIKLNLHNLGFLRKPKLSIESWIFPFMPTVSRNAKISWNLEKNRSYHTLSIV